MIRRNISDIFQSTGKYSKWSTHIADNVVVSVCGHAHYDHVYYCGEAFARIIAASVCGDWDMQIRNFLKRLNGNWSLVVLREDILYAATDRNRSYPLLYNELYGDLCLTDDFAKVCCDGIRWCSEGIEEFLWSGYPADRLTLADGVYQIPAGMFLRYEVTTKEKSFNEYFSFLPTGDNSDSDDQLSEKLAVLLDESVRRVVEAVRGKIVVPLSGGMDSRVIAALLKKNGFEDVLCFSYGRRGNSESEASKSVAEALGYEWHFVEYSPETWASCMFSQEMKDYLVFAGNGCSMPVCSNWYAVKTLCESGRISTGDTFMPGHTGMAGVHIPPYLFNRDGSIELKSIVEYIPQMTFSYWPGCPPERISLRLLEQFRSIMNDGPFNYLEANSLFEQWYWREWQAKFEINSDRVYEYFGCQWLTPLWDAFLIDYYLTIPIGMRYRKKLFFRAAVEKIFTDRLSVLSDIPLAVRGSLNPRQVLESLQKNRSWQFCERIARKVKRCLVTKRTLRLRGHALDWSHSFSDGKDPRRYTIREVFEKHGLGDFLDQPECESIVEFTDKPVGYIHAFGLISLSALAYMWALMRQAKQ